VNYGFSVEVLIVFYRVIGPKSVCVDGYRLLRDDHKEKSHDRFGCGYHRDDVSLIEGAISNRFTDPLNSSQLAIPEPRCCH